MSNQLDKLWTEEEKNILLTEILKRAGIPSAYLFSIIKENNIVPNWMEIPLPSGRSLHSCQTAYYRMEHEYAQTPYRQSLPSPINPTQLSPGTRKRPLPSLSSDKAPRAIQPKPLGEGFSTPSTRAPVQIPRLPETTEKGPPRKRGRPSKADIQRRTILAQARGETLPPPKKSTPRRDPLTQSPMMTSGLPSVPSSTGVAQQSVPTQLRDPVQEEAGSLQFQQMETPVSQTEDIQVRRIPRPHTVLGTVFPGTSTMQPKDSTPRAVLEGQMSISPSAFGSSFRGVVQQNQRVPSPRQEATLISSVGEPESGADPQAMQGLEEQRGS